MRPEEVRSLLEALSRGDASVDAVLRHLQHVPVEDLGFAQLDTHRELRQSLPEAIYAESKTTEQVVAIAQRLLDTTTGPVIATRVDEEKARDALRAFPEARYDREGRVVVFRALDADITGTVAVVAAGTSDLPVARECATTAEALAVKVDVIADVGVAGVHRVLAQQERLRGADVVVVVAGMEGALPSLVGGIVATPVVAVPTSVGYGASFGGVAALLGMLNSCAAGITVVNIDNGFGAALAAARLLNQRRD